MDYIILVLLVASSGLFSGLTIGLMGLSKSDVQMAADLGNENARKVMGVISNPSLLLVTLLLGNTAVNSTLSIFMGEIVGTGFISGVAATALILIFGEILPASLLSRHALLVGAKTSWLVLVLMKVLSPITRPMAFAIDNYLLKKELPSYLTKPEIKYLIAKYLKLFESDIDELDSKIVIGTMDLSSKAVGEHMSKTIYSLDIEEKITQKFLDMIRKRGISRIPVMKKGKIQGILIAKNLIGIFKGDVKDFITSKYLLVNAEDKIDDVLSLMINGHYHVAIVKSYDSIVGIITMEDILEEIFQTEIIDETDEESVSS